MMDLVVAHCYLGHFKKIMHNNNNNNNALSYGVKNAKIGAVDPEIFRDIPWSK